jgi:hypothetical protein
VRAAIPARGRRSWHRGVRSDSGVRPVGTPTGGRGVRWTGRGSGRRGCGARGACPVRCPGAVSGSRSTASRCREERVGRGDRVACPARSGSAGAAAGRSSPAAGSSSALRPCATVPGAHRARRPAPRRRTSRRPARHGTEVGPARGDRRTSGPRHHRDGAQRTGSGLDRRFRRPCRPTRVRCRSAGSRGALSGRVHRRLLRGRPRRTPRPAGRAAWRLSSSMSRYSPLLRAPCTVVHPGATRRTLTARAPGTRAWSREKGERQMSSVAGPPSHRHDSIHR